MKFSDFNNRKQTSTTLTEIIYKDEIVINNFALLAKRKNKCCKAFNESLSQQREQTRRTSRH